MSGVSKQSMRLFGIPYQFRKQVDPRMSTVNSSIGRKFLQNIVVEAPKITIIPGKPKYMPGASKDAKNTTTSALLSGAASGFSSVRQFLGKSTQDEIRYYDFSRAYTEYMTYVNILCRACAVYLEIDETLDGTSLARYDWRNYRQNASSYSSVAGNVKSKLGESFKKLMSAMTLNGDETTTVYNATGDQLLYETANIESGSDDEDTVESVLANQNYVQFYVDPDVSASESMNNSTTESKLKGYMDTGSDLMKEFAFLGNSAGLESLTTDISDFADSANSAFQDFIGSGGGLSTAISRIFSISSNVIKGENVIIPDIYQSSSYEKSYNFTVHLKCPYGTKFAYYMDVVVPLMHLIALGLPKQTTANTYGSPFLIKADVPGVFTCNMGMVSSITINKNVSPESWTVDGLPNEIDVTISMVDLYSDLAMSPQTSPILFVNNASLIEYLAMTCGLSVITPKLSTKVSLAINTVTSSIKDIPTTAAGYMTEYIDSTIANWVGLTW